MILDTHVDVGQVLLGISAILVAIPALAALLASRRNGKKLDELHTRTETGNAKNLGVTVHDLAVSSDSLAAQIHSSAQASSQAAHKAEVAAQRAEMAALVDSRVEFLVGAINAKLDDHILESRRVQEQLLKVFKGGEADV